MASHSQPSTYTQTPTNLDYITRAKGRLYTTFSTRRPWSQIFDRHALSLPRNLSEALTRVKLNLTYFRMNFAIVILIILFLSLLLHPLSLIVFFVLMVGWMFLYFLRDEPLVILSRSIDDRVVLTVLSVFTVVLLLLTGATGNILISVGVGVGLVVLYSVMRRTDDLFLDEENAVAGGLISSRVGSGSGQSQGQGQGQP